MNFSVSLRFHCGKTQKIDFKLSLVACFNASYADLATIMIYHLMAGSAPKMDNEIYIPSADLQESNI